jgi:hypothetical protein
MPHRNQITKLFPLPDQKDPIYKGIWLRLSSFRGEIETILSAVNFFLCNQGIKTMLTGNCTWIGV